MIVYGKQIFLYLLEKHPDLIEEIYLAKEIDKKLFSKISSLKVDIKRVDTKKAQAMSRGGNHQSFLLKVKDFEYSLFGDIKEGDFVLVLAGLTDVGNIGAIIRSAYSLGVTGVVISMVNSINLAAVARTSSGALFDMPVALVKDIGGVINELKQASFTVYCADMSGKDVRDVSFSSKKALVLGSEGQGLTNKILKSCDNKIKIQMQREFDSLNVSVACAILCDRMRDGK